jgi:mono/diheme cytochrome c family protein
MIFARMGGRAKITGVAVAATAVAFGVGACGSQGIQIAKTSPYYHGAVLFRDHCSGCHSLAVVGAVGSGFQIRHRLRTNGPNFNVRCEQANQVLYAIRNGGFSGAIMPENILLGPDAQAVAQFLQRYAGVSAKTPPGPGNVASPTASGTSINPICRTATAP